MTSRASTPCSLPISLMRPEWMLISAWYGSFFTPSMIVPFLMIISSMPNILNKRNYHPDGRDHGSYHPKSHRHFGLGPAKRFEMMVNRRHQKNFPSEVALGKPLHQRR